MSTIRELAETEIRGEPMMVFPLRLTQAGMVFDAENNHILDIRGWGKISYHRNADQLYEKVGHWVVDTLNAAYDAEKNI